MPKVNKTRYAILGILSITPGSGYDIKKSCDNGISYFWNENFGHIYPVLKRMEKEGVITKSAECNEGRPSRNVYSITPKGREELVEWLMRPVEHTPLRLELMLKLTFAKLVPADSILRELERIKEINMKSLDKFREIEAGFMSKENVRSDKGYPYWLSTLRYGLYNAELKIRWCEETIERIKSYDGIDKSI